MLDKNQVYIYVFDMEDGRSTEERLKVAAMKCCREAGWRVLPECSEASWKDRLQVARTDRGKPYFLDFPQIQVSVSHSGAYCICAVSGETIGVDLQKHVRQKEETIEGASIRFRKMARRFFHSVEADYVADDSYYGFYGLWAARESYVKYTGQGIDASFSEHCVIPMQKEQWPKLGEENGVVWQAQDVWFWERRYKEEYSLCVCTKNPCEYIVVDEK